MAVMLDVKNINVYYGAIHAVKDISFHVDEGEVETGRILKTAPAHTLLEDEDVKKAYLGG